MLKLNKVYCMDCLEGMKQLPDKSIDLCLTDPPYNAKNIGPRQKEYTQGIMQLPEEEYKKFCYSRFKEATRVSKNIVFTSGIANICYYPQPYWIICWHKPAAVSFNRMRGFNAWEPILIYGKPVKRIGQDYIKINTLNFKKGPEREHPCPKVLKLWQWLINNFSNEGDLILDPFMGSGTTAVGSNQFSRNFIGFELNPEYVKIAEKRLNSLPEKLTKYCLKV